MILERSILKEHVAPFLAAFCVITFLFAINYLINLLDSVLSKGLPFGLLLEVMVLSLAWMLALSIPMSFLVASLMAFGRLSADGEVTAMRSAGISPVTLMRPALAVAALSAVLLVIFNNWVLPEANHRAGSLLASISRKKPQAFIAEGQLLKQFPGVQIWIDRIDDETGRLHGIQVWEIENNQSPKIVLADSGWIEYVDGGATILLHLQSGWNHMRDQKDPGRYFRIRYEDQTLAVKNVDDSFRRSERARGDREMPVEAMMEVVERAEEKERTIREEQFPSLWGDMDRALALLRDTAAAAPDTAPAWTPGLVAPKTWNLVRGQEVSRQRPLRSVGTSLDREIRRQAQYRVEIHKKFALPVACVLFVLVGAPLGIVARTGGVGVGAVYSITFFVIYWVGLTGGEHMADKLMVSPELAMWAPNLVLLCAGLFFVYRLLKDLPMLPRPVALAGGLVARLFRAVRSLFRPGRRA